MLLSDILKSIKRVNRLTEDMPKSPEKKDNEKETTRKGYFFCPLIC